MKIDVLDHGSVRLVSHMRPVVEGALYGRSNEEIEMDPFACMQEVLADRKWSGDLEVVRNARVSYDADWRTGDDEGKDAKLLSYMVRNRHTSPFEAMVFTFEVKCPIFVARQWHRHRTWSYNEVSARYAELPEEFYIPSVEHVGVQSKSNKQMRELREAAGLDQAAQDFIEALQVHSQIGFDLYRKHLAKGIPRELARCFLGLNTYTRYFGTVDLHNLFHFLSLRLHEHAQWEIRQYAKALLELVRSVCPVSAKEFDKTMEAQ